MTQSAWTPADQDGYFRLTPVKRLGQPEDIAHAVLFLYLPQSDYITSQVLAVDGGFSIAGIQRKWAASLRVRLDEATHKQIVGYDGLSQAVYSTA